MHNVIGKGIDYASGPYPVTIPAREMSVIFDVPITNDNVLEETETFNLMINTSLPSRVIATNPNQATVTIVDDDGNNYDWLNKFGSYVHRFSGEAKSISIEHKWVAQI